MKTNLQTTAETSVAKTIAPEDLRPGIFVAVLNEVVEYPSLLWCDDVIGERDETVRVRLRASDGGAPLKVKAVCLPFVCVKTACGHVRTIDVRQVELVRLKRRYAKFVWKQVPARRRKKLRRQGR
ncbi:MAG: hypothetical protein DWQ34_05855 [Planctomycetota bacterium]|nr:MAG: hypothetical protein DWQ34_05855 [Planctomycetota bacterium]REK21951.1 MAG: hypothetical protein DWQ41_20325 [Planctomycetota bacterium]REK32137.1 MAG: hypothetical protein DWQ45_17470 [Planctomycetota bacterium]